MLKSHSLSKLKGKKLPLLVEKDEDGFYVVECPVLEGCYSQGRTLNAALKNIKKVINLILEERETKDILESYRPKELSFRTITL